MNTEEVKEYFFEDFKKEIQKVIESDDKLEVKSKILISPDKAIKYLESIGFEDLDKESNSWSWDFWCKLQYKDEIYYLCCSGYYNQGLTFYKK